MWEEPTADRQLQECLVGDEFVSGIRVDACLAQHFPEQSRAFFQKCIDASRVFLNGRLVRSKATKAMPGNVIEIDWPPSADDIPITGENIPLDILFEDDHILVLNKPAGLVVHPAAGNLTGTLVHALLNHNHAAFAEMLDQEQRPGIVHRLDKDTSGLLVVAKNLAARDALKQTFLNHDLDKIYLAMICGCPPQTAGTINEPIGRHPFSPIRRAVTPDGKSAISLYKLVSTSPDRKASLLKVKILTGRTHQIRVHLAHLGHPILGDTLYGARAHQTGIAPARQMLHAWRLTIPHPVTHERLSFEAPPPQDFLDIAQTLALTLPS